MAKSRIRDIAAAVTQAFEKAGFTPADLLQGPIGLTDLAWQTPPLRTTAMLAGLPFTSYVDYPLNMDASAFYDFYSQTLYDLHDDPGRVCGAQGYRRWQFFAAGVPLGERQLRLPVPQGWPNQMETTTGHLFAAECAELAHTSITCGDLIEDDSNFYVETEHGEIGIVAGSPSIYGDLWDSDVSGTVPLLTTQNRGLLDTNCMYDILARVRSVLYENMGRFVEFEGLDYALQTLRVMTSGRLCSELLAQIQGMSVKAFKQKRRLAIVEECLEVMSAWRFSDREKLGVIFEKLVPEVMNMSEYQRKVYDPYRMVTVLQAATEQKIVNRLKYLRKKFGGDDAAE
jgi:hypothetical protein